ncbi:hypothetical protein ACW95P_02255 [Candidatus Mycoplasma pogonae]
MAKIKIKNKVKYLALPFGVIPWITGISFAYANSDRNYKNQIFTQTSLLTQKYEPNITHDQFINRAKQMYYNTINATNTVTDLDWILNPYIKLKINNKLDLYKNNQKTENFPAPFENHNIVDKARDFNGFIKYLNDKKSWLNQHQTYEKVFNISAVNFANELNNSINENALKMNFYTRNNEDYRSIYHLENGDNFHWVNFWGNWQNHDVNFDYFEWQIPQNNHHFSSNFIKETTQPLIENHHFKISQNKFLNNYINSYENKTMKMHFRGPSDKKLYKMNWRTYSLMHDLLLFNARPHIFYEVFYEPSDMSKEKWVWHNYDSSPFPRYDSPILKSGKYSRKDISDILNFLLVAAYQADKDLTSPYEAVKQWFNSSAYIEYQNRMLNQYLGSYKKVDYIPDENTTTFESYNRRSDHEAYEKLLYFKRTLPSIDNNLLFNSQQNHQISKNQTNASIDFDSNIIGDWRVEFNTGIELFNTAKQNVNLMDNFKRSHFFNAPEIDKVDLSKIYTVRTNFENGNYKFSLGLNIKLVKAFYNYAYLPEFYKKMSTNVISQNQFNSSEAIKRLFNNDYQNYVSFYNKSLALGLKGFWEFNELKAAETLFIKLKNTANIFDAYAFNAIKNNQNQQQFHLNNGETILVPHFNINKASKASWVNVLHNSGFEFEEAVNDINLNANSIYRNSAMNSYIFDDGTSNGVINEINKFNFYYNFLLPAILKQDVYAYIQEPNSNSLRKVKLYDSNRWEFNTLNVAKQNYSSQNVDSNAQFILSDVTIDNQKHVLGKRNFYGNNSSQISIPVHQIINSAIENFNNSTITHETLSKNFGLTATNEKLYWNIEDFNNPYLLNLNQNTLKPTSKNSSIKRIFISNNIVPVFEQLSPSDYLNFFNRDKLQWSKLLEKVFYEVLTNNLAQNNAFINNEISGKIIDEIYLKSLLKNSENFNKLNTLLATENIFNSFTDFNYEKKLIDALIVNHIDLKKLLPNDDTGSMFILATFNAKINPKQLSAENGFYLVDKKLSSQGKVVEYQYLINIYSHYKNLKFNSEIINDIKIKKAHNSQFIEEENIIQFVEDFAKDENNYIFKLFTETKAARPEINYEVVNDKFYLTAAYTNKDIEDLKVILSKITNINLLPKTWILDLKQNIIKIPLENFVNIKQKINLPILKDVDFNNSFAVGWNNNLEKNITLEDVARQFNDLDIWNKKAFFEINNADKISNILLSTKNNQLIFSFIINSDVYFASKTNELVFSNFKNIVGIENLNAKEQLINLFKKQDLLTKNIDKFNGKKLNEKLLYFNSTTTNEKPFQNGIKNIELEKVISKQDENLIFIKVKVDLNENYVWKNALDEELLLEISFDAASEEKIKVSKTQNLPEPKINLIALQSLIDKHNIYDAVALEVLLKNMSLLEKTKILNWNTSEETIQNVLTAMIIEIMDTKMLIELKVNDKFKWNDNFNGVLKTSKIKYKPKPIPKIELPVPDRTTLKPETEIIFIDKNNENNIGDVTSNPKNSNKEEISVFGDTNVLNSENKNKNNLSIILPAILIPFILISSLLSFLAVKFRKHPSFKDSKIKVIKNFFNKKFRKKSKKI